MKPALKRFLATHRRRTLGPGPEGSCETVVYEPIDVPFEAAVSWPTVIAAGIVSAFVSAATTLLMLVVVAYRG